MAKVVGKAFRFAFLSTVTLYYLYDCCCSLDFCVAVQVESKVYGVAVVNETLNARREESVSGLAASGMVEG